MPYNINILGEDRNILVMSPNGGWSEGLGNSQAVSMGGNVAVDMSAPPQYVAKIGNIKLYYRQKITDIASVSRIYYYQPENELQLYRIDGLTDPEWPDGYSYGSFINQYLTHIEVGPSSYGFVFVIQPNTPWTGDAPLSFHNLYVYFYNASVGFYNDYSKSEAFNPFQYSIIESYAHDRNDLASYARSRGYLGYAWNISDDSNRSTYALGHFLVEARALPDTHEAFMQWLSGQEIKPENPFDGGGTSEGGGFGGDWESTGEAVTGTGLPPLSALDSGFITAFNPDATQLKVLADYMWNNNLFDLQTYKKLFSDPMDCIIGLSMIPIKPTRGSFKNVNVGNLVTSVELPTVTQQYYEIDCGTINVPNFSGTYLDYDPYYKIEIYLPFCGVHHLRADDIVGRSLKLTYRIDILSGGCVAELLIVPHDGEPQKKLYSFIGQCSSSIPISGKDMTQVINGVLNIANDTTAMVTGASGTAGLGVVKDATGLKPSISHSGNLSGISGMLANRRPYLLITKPRLCTPKNKGTMVGYQYYVTEVLSDMEGYTEVEAINLQGCSALDEEKEMIKSILSQGVLI